MSATNWHYKIMTFFQPGRPYDFLDFWAGYLVDRVFRSDSKAETNDILNCIQKSVINSSTSQQALLQYKLHQD